MKKLVLVFLLFACFSTLKAQQIQSPSGFLGYPLGDQFTPHYRIAEYFRYIARTSKNVRLVQYGTTNEGRPLLAAFIASDENINRLEDIRQNNLRLAGLSSGQGSTDFPAIVWLSYNIHGNEPSSSEAAMQMLFQLVDPSNSQTKNWLKNTVVVIDPCQNPDGRDRYVNFYNPVHATPPDADPAAREHREPWPGGRYNHYYFDMNRDWAWQTQKESQAKLALYNQWLPEIHVDFHEQGYNAPYYFAPAAEPFHKNITHWQREFQVSIGKNNAKYFDRNGWLYFTKQEFDLLYPSYGDTYPLYNGSIGMTFEQGGIGAGLAIKTASGDTLTLADRIAHHLTTGLSTVETASANSKKLLEEFKRFFDRAKSNPPGAFKTYVVKNENPDKLKALAKLLDKNSIQYGFGGGNSFSGFNYITGKTERFNITANDMVITSAQPKAILLNVLMEPKTFMSDSNTYDITAWSLPYVYGLKTYGIKEALQPQSTSLKNQEPDYNHKGAYAYVGNWKSLEDVKFLAALMQKNIKVRVTEQAFDAAGKKFAAGSLIITRAGNAQLQDRFDETVQSAAKAFERNLTPLTSGFVEKGNDLGFSSVHAITKPKIMLLTGDDVSASAVGEVWFYFEKELHYPVSLINTKDLNRVKLSDFDVAIFPDGYYNDFPAEPLQAWVSAGGKLILMENALTKAAGKKSFAIKLKEDKKPDADADARQDPKKKTGDPVKAFGNRQRAAISENVAGAIYKVNLDNTHPLGFGFPDYYFTLKQDNNLYEFLSDGWNVGTIRKNAYTAGFVGQKAKAGLQDGLVFGVQDMGRGQVVYLADDPLFRSFWENGKLLFSNAVFMVN
ncbi:M14 family metallopeptidase [Mucilaginibacter arboris]|uniref:Zinc carboxypeptidase n=1 Tax=Mucilaginibacter arboris TaxID=2682090 RepID=A0A7K1SSD5_9SPHI|nr:M14 family metallopeptidase [Mucilaginibacter arboris]MVN20223.1 zinc carboxypeptidase [Mucilaginibacter arboris]